MRGNKNHSDWKCELLLLQYAKQQTKDCWLRQTAQEGNVGTKETIEVVNDQLQPDVEQHGNLIIHLPRTSQPRVSGKRLRAETKRGKGKGRLEEKASNTKQEGFQHQKGRSKMLINQGESYCLTLLAILIN